MQAVTWLKRGFHPTQRKERNEMTSLLDRPITAASDDNVCCWHAAKLWQTRAKLLKFYLICIISCTTSKKRTEIWTIDFFTKMQTLKTWVQRTARFLLAGACVLTWIAFLTLLAFIALRWMETPLKWLGLRGRNVSLSGHSQWNKNVFRDFDVLLRVGFIGLANRLT